MVDKKITFKAFKEKCSRGGFVLRAAEDIPGFAKKNSPLYGDCGECDDLIVANWLYQPLNDIYTVYLKTK